MAQGWGFPALPAVLWGWLLGSAAQTYQRVLWPLAVYAVVLCVGLAAWLLALVWHRRWRAGLARDGAERALGTAALRWGAGVWTLGCCAVMAFAVVGWRASAQQAQALDPALEGVGLRVTGVVTSMPQVLASGVRFRLAVESAHRVPSPSPPQLSPQAAASQAPMLGDADHDAALVDTDENGGLGAAVTLPPVVELAWYSGGWYASAGQHDHQRTARSPNVTGVRGTSAAVPAVSAVPTIGVGQRWTFTVRLKAPHGLSNPHGFDYELWMWEQGVQAAGSIRTGAHDEPPRFMEATGRYPIEQWRQRVRDAILARLTPPAPAADSLSDDDDGWAAPDAAEDARRIAGVVAALVTGDQRAIERADWDVFRATGVAHLMSISGLHITLFAWLAGLVVGRGWRWSARACGWLPAPVAGWLAGLVLAGGYALFSGWGIPAQRTVLMLAALVLLRCSGQRWPWPVVWLLAATVVVVWDPWAWWQAGFWLSFVAVGALFAAGASAPTPTAPTTAPSRVRAYAWAMLREQWVVTLALTPLSLLLFGQISWVSMLANAVAIPWVTLVVTPLALGGIVAPPLWHGAAWALQPLMVLLQWLASWPGAVVVLPVAPWALGVLAVAGGLVMAMRGRWWVRSAGALCVLPVLLWHPARPVPGQFELLAMDIGQGNAVLVRTAHHSLLYDTGPQMGGDSDAGDRVINPLLRAMGERLDRVVLSHRDSDHTGGAAAVLSQQPQASVLGSLESSHPLQRVRPVQPCKAGQQWVWDGVQFTVLYPSPETAQALLQQHGAPTDRRSSPLRPNAVSCVLRVQAQASTGTQGTGAAALLVGDIETAQEASLVATQPQQLRADWLMVPHHGSKTSSTPAFIAAVSPQVAVVQAGYRNRFGHPRAVVLQRYAQQSTAVYASPSCGAARWNSWEPARMECQREKNLRYWHHRVPAP